MLFHLTHNMVDLWKILPAINYIAGNIFQLFRRYVAIDGKLSILFPVINILGEILWILNKSNIFYVKSNTKFRPDPDARLMEQVREVLRYFHYAYRTEQTYCDWILRYIKFHGSKTHPGDMGKKEIEAFLSALARRQNYWNSYARDAKGFSCSLEPPGSDLSN